MLTYTTENTVYYQNLTSTCLRCSSKSECIPKEIYKYDMIFLLKGRMRKSKEICKKQLVHQFIFICDIRTTPDLTTATWWATPTVMEIPSPLASCKTSSRAPNGSSIPHIVKEKIFILWRIHRQFLHKNKKEQERQRKEI